MGILTREQILAAEDLPKETVPVPEWGGDVIVRSMTAVERDDLEAHFLSERAKSKEGVDAVRNFRARTLVLCIVDESGKRLFEKPEDVDALGRKNAAVISRLFGVVERVNGLSETAVGDIAKK